MHLSIIIPTYNSEKTLKKCLDSVFSQDFNEFEVCVIDGVSTDNTILILEEYAKAYSNLHYLSEPDKGIYDAMNKGVAKSIGEWIYFLGSDDTLYSSSILHIITNYTLDFNLDIVYGNVFSNRFNGIYGGEFDFKRILHQNICHQAIFFRREVFVRVGNFNLRYKANADWEHNIKWLLSDKIKKQYINITIADYAEGGFSSCNIDFLFENEKILIYLKNINKLIPISSKIEILKKEFDRIKTSRNRKLFFKYVLNLYQII